MNDQYWLTGDEENGAAPASEPSATGAVPQPADDAPATPLTDAEAAESAAPAEDWRMPDEGAPETLIPLEAAPAEPIPLAEIPVEEALPRQEMQPTGTSSPEEETPAAVELLPFEDYLVYGSPADEPLPLDPLPFDSTPVDADVAAASAARQHDAPPASAPHAPEPAAAAPESPAPAAPPRMVADQPPEQWFVSQPPAAPAQPASDETPAPEPVRPPAYVFVSPAPAAAPQPHADELPAAEPPAPEPEPTPAPFYEPDEAFEALTVAEALGQARRAPRRTVRAFWAVLRTPAHEPAPAIEAMPPEALPSAEAVQAAAVAHRIPSAPRPPMARPRPQQAVIAAATPGGPIVDFIAQDEAESGRLREALVLAGRIGAWLIAVVGCLRMVGPDIANDDMGLAAGLGWIVLGMVLWLIIELANMLIRPAEGRVWLFQRTTIPAITGAALSRQGRQQRVFFMVAGLVLAFLSVLMNANNRFTFAGVAAWAGSIALVFFALAPAGWSVVSCARAARRALRPHFSWALVAVLALMAAALIIRLIQFSVVPSEMSSDHVEMLLDTANVQRGQYDVFFANNGGREAMQFYLLSIFGSLPGLGVNFDTLKLLGVIEGVLTIPMIFWMAREIIGREQRRLSTLVGLCAAGLVVVSMWHITLSRQGERIVLMPLFTALFVLYFARAMRYGRRMDYLYAGLALGFGMYTYQAFRVMPVVVIIGALITLFFQARADRAVRALIVNTVMLALMAFIVFLPLFSFSLQYPNDFWRRTSGRIFGEDVIVTTNDAGETVTRDATFEERVAAFGQNVGVFASNLRGALFSFNLRGDVAWFNNPPNQPFFDPVSGGLLVVGVAGWTVLMVRRRDPVIWLMPAFVFVMILPSALAIAFPIENPSATRMSGSLPAVYVMAGSAMAVLILGAVRIIRGIPGWAFGAAAVAAVLAASFSGNYTRYFVDYPIDYQGSSLAYSDAARVLREFAQKPTGGWGNAFIINIPYWWDHRAVGIEAGRPDWPNGILSLAETPRFLADALQRGGEYRLDPTHDLLFFYSTRDPLTHDWLLMTFPQGEWQEWPTSDPTEFFRTYTVPAIGEDGMQRFLQMTLPAP